MNSDSMTSLERHNGWPASQYTLSEAERRERVLDLSVGLLIERTEIGDTWTDGFSDVATFLEAVPLTTAEYRSASGHLKNALEYCRTFEFGAAAFELRVVRGILQSQ